MLFWHALQILKIDVPILVCGKYFGGPIPVLWVCGAISERESAVLSTSIAGACPHDIDTQNVQKLVEIHGGGRGSDISGCTQAEASFQVFIRKRMHRA